MQVVPFPRTRDKPYVRRQAARMADYSETAAENYLSHQLALQRSTMEKRGIAAPLIAAHLSSLENAIRFEFNKITVVFEGGVA